MKGYTSIIVNTGNAVTASTVGFNIPSTLGYLEKDKVYTLQFKARALRDVNTLDYIYVGTQKLQTVDLRTFDTVLVGDVEFKLCYVTFVSDSTISKPSVKISRAMSGSYDRNVDIYEFTDISLSVGTLSQYDVNVGDFRLLRAELNTKIQQLSDMIRLSANSETIDQLTGEVSRALGQIQVSAGNISLKTEIDDVKSIIELNPSSLMVGFNGMSEHFKISKDGIDFSNSGTSYKNISIRKGTYMFYNWETGGFIGGMSPLLLGGNNKSNAGIGLVTSANSSYIMFASDSNWTDSSSGSKSPVSAMDINFIDRGSETALLKGIQLFLKMYARNGINLVNTGDIENLRDMFLSGKIQFSRGYNFIEFENGVELNGTLQAGGLSANVITCKSGNNVYSNANIVPYIASKYNCGEYSYPWYRVYSTQGVYTGVTYSLEPTARTYSDNSKIIDLIDVSEDGKIDVTNIIGSKYESELLEGNTKDGYFVNQDRLVSTIVKETKQTKIEQDLQNYDISTTEEAVNFLLMGTINAVNSLQESSVENKNIGGNGMASYLGNQIYKGKLDYDAVVAKYPQFKNEIDIYLETRLAMDGVNSK